MKTPLTPKSHKNSNNIRFAQPAGMNVSPVIASPLSRKFPDGINDAEGG